MKYLYLFLLIISFSFVSKNSQAQFSVTSEYDADSLALYLAGPGVVISNATIVCDTNASGYFNNAPAGLGLQDGVLLTTGSLTQVVNASSFQISNATPGTNDGDIDLDTILIDQGLTYVTNDACALEFDIEVTGDSLNFQYVFSSEEYPETGTGDIDDFVCSINDIFAFFITGPNPLGGAYNKQNVALIPGTNLPVSINSVNDGTEPISTNINGDTICYNNYTAFYNGDVPGIAYDGNTEVLTASAATVPCQTYHFKLVIGDGSDQAWDSGVFLAEGSFSSNAVIIGASSVLGQGFNEAVEGCVDGLFTLEIDTAYNFPVLVGYDISGTATNGTDYVLISDSILMPAGDTLIDIPINVIADGIAEGTETIILTPYTVCGTLGTPSILEIVDDYPHSATINNTFLCSPSIITLTGTGAQFYSWSDSTLLTDPDSAVTTTINPVNQSTTFYLDGVLGTCTFTDTVSVGVSQSNPTFHIQEISCAGAADGMYWIELNDSAAEPFTYSFPISGTTDSILTGIGNGQFHLASATDSFGCVFNGPFHFFNDPIGTGGVIFDYDSIPISCTGADDGEICLFNMNTGTYVINIDTNGILFGSYGFASNSDTFCISSLAAGTYDAFITNDTTGCSDSFSLTLLESLIPCSNFYKNDIPCFGENNGSICVYDIANGNYTASGTYNGNPIVPVPFVMNSDTFCLDNLLPGIYDISIQNGSGFNEVYLDTIFEPALLTTSINIVGPDLCAGGSIDSLISINAGGTMPYVYNWNNGTGPNTASYNNASFGSHTFLLTDDNGCLDSAMVNIIEPTGMYLSISQDSVNCFGGNDGLAYIDSISGGTLPYTFSWNDPLMQSNDSAINLSAGQIILTVTDSGNCSLSDTVIVEQPADSVQIMLTTTGIPCFGDTTCIDATVTGGPPPYTFNWNNGEITEDICGIDTGTFVLIVTDANGCEYIDSITITQPDDLSVFINVMGTGLCAGGSIDSLVSIVTGGTLNYQYQWSNGPTTSNISSVAFGNYTVIVTDANNCIDSSNVSIVAPTPMFLNIEQDSVLCFDGNSGMAYVDSLSGGNPPFTYFWNTSPVQTTDTAFSLNAGQHNLIVTDLNGCTIEDSVTVLEPLDSISIILITNTISCFGGDTCIDALVSGGIAPYTYLWNDALAQTTEDICGAVAGTYTLIVTDANGCTNSATITVSQVAEIDLTMDSTNIECFGGNNGSATVNVIGGSGIYTYLWDDAMAQTTATASNLTPGSYSVIVADANDSNCTKTASVTITEPSDSIAVTLANLQDVLCFGTATGAIDVNISGGTSPYNYSWTGGTNNEDLSGAIANTYTLTVIDANLCDETFTDIIDQPAILAISLTSSTDVNCFGGNNGAIDISVAGGVSPYTYSWSSGPMTEDLTGLTSGSYTITVTDFNNCSVSETYIINQPANVSISFNYSNYNGVNISCNGGSDGTVEAIVTGGNAPFTYSWDNMMTGSLITGLPANIDYTVTVTDANLCVYSQTTTILTEPSALTIDKDSTMITCAGYNDGTATALPSGGIAPYTYLWSDPAAQTTATATGLAPGNYTCAISDANGSCAGNITVTIIEPSAIIVTTSIDSVKCWGDADGSIIVNASGGNSTTFEYSINGGLTYQSSNTFTNLTAGVYDEIIVRQNGSNGCLSATVSEIVLEPEPMFIFINPDDTTVQLQESVTMAIVVDPATGYFNGTSYSNSDITSISWTPTNGLNCTDCSNPTALVFDDTEYTATVLYSPYACETSASATINVENNLKFFIPNSFSPNGDGINDIHYVYGEGLKDFSIAIYNRIGEKVFDSSLQSKGWDGTFKGVLQNPGVFSYYFKAIYLDDKEIDSKGSITIIR